MPKITIKKNAVLAECREAIKEYKLKELLKGNFEELKDKDKENAVAGLIRLGEALTYCRGDENKIKNKALQDMGIVPLAINCANIRNILIHHYLYRNPDKIKELQVNIQAINFNALEKILDKLEQSTLNSLEKPLGVGNNEFDFDFKDYIRFLENEFKLINLYAELVKKEEDLGAVSGLRNHVRNGFMILLDLLDEKRTNTNKGKPCEEEKLNVALFNEQFANVDEDFPAFFTSLKDHRNKLSHLNTTPYNFETIKEFSKILIKIERAGYTNRLTLFLSEMKNPVLFKDIAASSSYFDINKKPRNEVFYKAISEMDIDDLKRKLELAEQVEQPIKKPKTDKEEVVLLQGTSSSLENSLEKDIETPKDSYKTVLASKSNFFPSKESNQMLTTPLVPYEDDDEDENTKNSTNTPSNTPNLGKN